MPDYTRNFQYEMPIGTDSMALSQGLGDITSWVDAVDSRLSTVAAMGTDPALFLGVWDTNGVIQSISSSTTPTNITLGLVNRVNFPGTGTPTVNTTNGDIQFPTAGIYRLTISIVLGTATPNTEAQFSFGLKPSGVASYVSRCSHYGAVMTWVTNSILDNKSFIVKAAATGGNVDLTTQYKIGFQQSNTAGFNFAYGGSTTTLPSWFSIEYLRPVT